MKRLLIVSMLLALVGFGGSALAQSGEVLMTAKRSGNDIVLVFEALNEGGVVAVQYELNLAGIDPEQVDLSGCVGSYAGSQLAGCNAVRGAVRVGIINQGLSDMPTGELGRITLRNLKTLPAGMELINVAVVDRTGNERPVQPLVDFGGLQSGKPAPGRRLE